MVRSRRIVAFLVSAAVWALLIFLSFLSNRRYMGNDSGSVPVDLLRPKYRVAYTKHDLISILMNKYTYINMYII